MTTISPRHAAARRIAGSFPNPLDLSRPEPCAPDTAASLRTAYDAAWDAANAAWDELPGEEAPLSDEAALIAELETILAREGEGAEPAISTAVALLESDPIDFVDEETPRRPMPALMESLALLEPPSPDDDLEAYSNVRHLPDEAKTSLAMVLDAAPRRAPRHVHRAPARETRAEPAPTAVRPPRKNRRPVLGTVAIAVVLLGGVGGAVLFLDGNGTPAAQQTTASNIPWIQAQAGVSSSLLARPAPTPVATAEAVVPPATPDAAAGAVATPLAEKADERVPATDAVPPLLGNDVRLVTTQPVTGDAPAAAAPVAATPAPAAAAPETPAPAAQTGVTATTWVNMRAGAGADEAVVAVVEPGAAVQVIACENWCEVVVNGQRGYIYNEYLAGLR